MLSGYVLPRVLEPKGDESLSGFLMRTAEAYRFHDPRRLLSRLDMPKLTLWSMCRVNPTSELGSGMATLLGLDTSTFQGMSMWTGDETTLSVLGTEVWLELVRHTSRMVCPLCLRNSNYHRAVWLIDALPVCAVHDVWLRDRCADPGCARPLRWSGLGVHRCGAPSCRADLRDAPLEKAESGQGVRALHRVLHQLDLAPLGMPEGEVVTIAFLLGQMAMGLTCATRPSSFIRRNRHRIPEVMERGWRALADWPRGFHNFLDELRHRDSRGLGLRAAFGPLSKYVHGWAHELWGQPFGTAFADYAAAQPYLATTRYALQRYAPGAELQQPHVTLADAANLVGCNASVLRKVAERRKLFILPPKGEGRPSRLATRAVLELRAEMSDALLPEEARHMLGLSARAMEQVEAAGLVRRVPVEARIAESRPFRRTELDTFIKACAGCSELLSADEARGRGLKPISRVVAPGRNHADVCRALATGRLSAAAKIQGQVGIRSLRLQLAEVKRVVPVRRATFSLLDAASDMGVKHSYLAVWAERGFLRTVLSERVEEKGRRIAPEDWHRFRKEHVTGGELVELIGRDKSTWLSRDLRYVGVEPISGPGIDRCKLSLFRRADLTANVLAKLHRLRDRPRSSATDNHRQAFARSREAADVVAASWGVAFRRVNNRFLDDTDGRTVQVVVGRQAHKTGVWRFKLDARSMKRLRLLNNVWVALVPNASKVFLLVPLGQLHWTGDATRPAYTTVCIDGRGNPLELQDFIHPLKDYVDPALVS